tara:strand:- start:126 stop:326 length:201 start_codon:yes stop_codon:yes gene_type:complete
MTIEELAAIQEMHPTALSVWVDRMHDKDKGQLISYLLEILSAGELLETLSQIEADIAESRREDYGT